MPVDQQFHCSSKAVPRSSVVLKTVFDSANDQDIILWDSVEHVFPGIQYLLKDDCVVEFERGPDFKILEPRRIRAFPESVLEVVLMDPIATQQTPPQRESLQSPPQTPGPQPPPSAHSTPSQQSQTKSRTKETPMQENPHSREHLIHTQPPPEERPAPQLVDQDSIWNTTFDAFMNDLLYAQYPRLFVLIPAYPLSHGFNPFVHLFRIHFLCEHGQSVGANGSAQIPFEVHCTSFHGHDVDDPKQFLEACGPYVLRVLQVVRQRALFSDTTILNTLTGTQTSHEQQTTSASRYSPREMIGFIDDAITTLQESTKSLTAELNLSPDSPLLLYGDKGTQAQARAQIESDIKNQWTDFIDKVRLDLIRVVKDGIIVKWVCRYHYDEEFTKSSIKQFFMCLRALGAKSNAFSRRGQLTLILKSPALAKQLYRGIEATKGAVNELRLTMDWDVTVEDMDTLQNVVFASNIISLGLKITKFQDGVVEKANAIFRMMTGGKLQVLTFSGWDHWQSLASNFPQYTGTPTLRVLYLENCGFPDGNCLEPLFRANSNLIRVNICENAVDDTKAAIKNYPITLDITLAASHSGAEPLFSLAVKGNPDLMHSWHRLGIDIFYWSHITELTMPATKSVNLSIYNILLVNPRLRSITVDYTEQPCILDIVGISYEVQDMEHLLECFTIKSGLYYDMLVTKFNQGAIGEISVIKLSGFYSGRRSILQEKINIQVSTEDTWPWCKLAQEYNKEWYLYVSHWDSPREKILANLMTRLPPIPVSIKCLFGYTQSLEIIQATKRVTTICGNALRHFELLGSQLRFWPLELKDLMTQNQPTPNLKRLVLVGLCAEEPRLSNLMGRWLATTVAYLNQLSGFEYLGLSNVQLSEHTWDKILNSIQYRQGRALALSNTNLGDTQLELLEATVPRNIDFTLLVGVPLLMLSQTNVRRIKDAFDGCRTNFQIDQNR